MEHGSRARFGLIMWDKKTLNTHSACCPGLDGLWCSSSSQFAMGKLVQMKVIYCTVDKYMGLAFDNILCEL